MWPLTRVHVFEPFRGQWQQMDTSAAHPLRAQASPADQPDHLMITQGANTVERVLLKPPLSGMWRERTVALRLSQSGSRAMKWQLKFQSASDCDACIACLTKCDVPMTRAAGGGSAAVTSTSVDARASAAMDDSQAPPAVDSSQMSPVIPTRAAASQQRQPAADQTTETVSAQGRSSSTQDASFSQHALSPPFRPHDQQQQQQQLHSLSAVVPSTYRSTTDTPLDNPVDDDTGYDIGRSKRPRFNDEYDATIQPGQPMQPQLQQPQSLLPDFESEDGIRMWMQHVLADPEFPAYVRSVETVLEKFFAA